MFMRSLLRRLVVLWVVRRVVSSACSGWLSVVSFLQYMSRAMGGFMVPAELFACVITGVTLSRNAYTVYV